MSLIIDLIIILAAAAAIYLGISRGFIKSVMHFASLILALVAVFMFTSPLSAWLNDAYIGDKVTGIAESSITGLLKNSGELIDINSILSEPPEAFTGILERFSVSTEDLQGFVENSNISFVSDEAVDVLAQKIAEPAASAISTAVAAIIIFVTAVIVLKLLTLILDLIFSLPILKKLNKLLGAIFGVGSAVISAWVIANLAVALIKALESVNDVIFNPAVIDGSIILRFFYDHSLLFI